MASRFLFHGEVVTFGARLDRPRLRHAEGTIALPGIGGRVATCVTSPDLGPLVRFAHSTCSVSGERRLNGYETRATCSVEDVEIPGLLRVDLLSSVLTSRYVDEHVFHEESVVVEGLRILGNEYLVDSQNLAWIRECPTWERVRASAEAGAPLAAAFTRGGTPSGKTGPVPTRAGDYACYLLEAHLPEAKDRPVPCACVKVGATTFDVYIGEYLIAERQRRLTLLRVEAHRREAVAVKRAVAGAAPAVAAPAAAAPEPEIEGALILGQSLINGQTHP
jgi:hypothetical protein